LVATHGLPQVTRDYYRYLAPAKAQPHTIAMGLYILFVAFLQRVGVGAGAVVALLLIVSLTTPRRSAAVIPRRKMN
jgi:hypothetical protein